MPLPQGPRVTAYDTYKQKFYKDFTFSRNDHSNKTFEAGKVYELQVPVASFAHVIVDLFVQFCCQFENSHILDMSSGRSVLLPQHTPATTLPGLGPALASGRVKHVTIGDYQSLLATLHMMPSIVTGRHTLLVIHSMTPLLMSLKTEAHLDSTFRMLHQFADSCLAYVVWVTSESPSASEVRERNSDIVAQAWRRNFSKKMTFSIR